MPTPRKKRNLKSEANFAEAASSVLRLGGAGRAFSPSITAAMQEICTDCAFCDGLVPLKQKKHGSEVNVPCLL